MDGCENCDSIVRRVISKCIQEKNLQCCVMPVEHWLDRASHYTGLSKINLNQLVTLNRNKDNDDDDTKQQKLSVNEKIIISNVLTDCYKESYSFGYPFLHLRAKFNCNVQDFQQIMNNSGYYSIKADADREILIEDPKLRFDRYHYLQKILTYRHNSKHIYYLEEIELKLIDNTLFIRKPDLQASSPGSESYVFNPIMFYACSIDGCTSSLFCFQQEQAKEDFLKWIIHTLIPSLTPSSVIVVDKSCIHRLHDEANINRNHSKEQMIKWLREHKIPWDISMHKADLYQLIEKCSFKDTNYKIDQIFKAYGHEVVHLPCQLHELSMSRLMLKHLKEILPAIPPHAKPISKKMYEYVLLKTKLSGVISNLDFYSFHEEILKYEESLHAVDLKIEDILDSNCRLNIQENRFIESCSSCYGNEVLVKIDNLSLD